VAEAFSLLPNDYGCGWTEQVVLVDCDPRRQHLDNIRGLVDAQPLLISGSPLAHPALALVSRAQGGLTLGLEADFCYFG
jgi:hypothetical protein